MIAAQQLTAKRPFRPIRLADHDSRPLAKKLRPEAQLLLLCARSKANDYEIQQIQALLNGELDWEYLLTKSHEHCITPLLHLHLDQLGDSQVPAHAFALLDSHVAGNSRFNLYRTAELIRLLRLLKLNGISALPFKGPVLSVQAYGSLGLREYGDLDLLVHPEDVSRTADLFIAYGYHLVSSLRRRETNRRFVPRNKDLIFENASQSIRLELHWRLTGKHFSFPLELPQLWRRLGSISLAGATLPTLGTEDLLLYLCSHGSRHGWERVIWICDLAELLRAYPAIDWEYVVSRARTLGAERMLTLGLVLVRDLLGVELSPGGRQSMNAEPATEALASEIASNLFEEHKKDISYWHKLHLQLRERRLERLRLRSHYTWRYLRLAVTPNERDHSLLAIRKPLTFLYYVLRPLRLVSELCIPRVKALARRLIRQVR